MSPETPEQLNDELRAGWEHLRSTAAAIAELQTTMWGDWAELTAGLATGRLAWGKVYSEYCKFVADEDLRFALELSGLGIDYARRMAEVTREHEQRLRDHLGRTAWGDRADATDGDDTGDDTGDGDGPDGKPAGKSRTAKPEQ
ncbi:hypothetical protein [Streptomyces sp. LS1784]|uniref:hypothetical protein n=1 Tax=Streptomyces sp. LS1784 TaxID=2851533 RepID=UPI001CCD58E5|nr:hypothetical protein [Streptomyces sp. LS1784]